ncbi:MAG: SUMF1/EgtB/PvdO family nonheme iron enzyme, partial [Bacteroidota bacterium]
NSWKMKTQDDGHTHTAPVKSYRANSLGLYDMSGNVYEWCWDRHDDYSKNSSTNPKGPNTGANSVIRGGSWDNEPAVLRCARRDYAPPGLRSYNIGFRLSRAGS